MMDVDNADYITTSGGWRVFALLAWLPLFLFCDHGENKRCRATSRRVAHAKRTCKHI